MSQSFWPGCSEALKNAETTCSSFLHSFCLEAKKRRSRNPKMPQVWNYAAAWVEDTFSKKCLKRVSRYVYDQIIYSCLIFHLSVLYIPQTWFAKQSCFVCSSPLLYGWVETLVPSRSEVPAKIVRKPQTHFYMIGWIIGWRTPHTHMFYIDLAVNWTYSLKSH